jgi:hypothetical protein
MHPAAFFKEVKFSSMNGWASYDCTDDILKTLTDIHPSQIVFGRIKIPLWQVKFRYRTVRGNYREHIRYIFCGSYEEADMMIEMQFKDYIDRYNKENKYRAMEDVQILSITPVANAILEVN